MPIADWISDPIATERHERVVPTTPERAIEIAMTMPADADPVIGALMRMRGMKTSGATMEDFFTENGFVELKREPREVVVGIGAETELRPKRVLEDPADWHGWNQPRSIKAAANFLAEPEGEGARVITETWVEATDEAAAKRFRRYWMLVGPFSALIRRRWLRGIAKRAEAESAA